jgi:hypothetical protein
VKSNIKIQTSRLEIKEMNTRARSTEVDNKQKRLEIALLCDEAKIMATPSINT